MAKQTLNLDALIETDQAFINSKTIEIRPIPVLSPIDGYKVAAYGRRYEELFHSGQLDEAQEAELKLLPAKVCALVVVNFTADMLTPEEQWAVVRSFIDPRAREAKPTQAPATPAEPVTGEK